MLSRQHRMPWRASLYATQGMAVEKAEETADGDFWANICCPADGKKLLLAKRFSVISQKGNASYIQSQSAPVPHDFMSAKTSIAAW